MPDPDVRVHIFELVILDDIVAVTDHLEHQQVLTVRKHKSARFSGGGVELRIQFIGVLEYDLIFDFALGSITHVVLRSKRLDNFRLDAHKIIDHFWRGHIQA